MYGIRRHLGRWTRLTGGSAQLMRRIDLANMDNCCCGYDQKKNRLLPDVISKDDKDDSTKGIVSPNQKELK